MQGGLRARIVLVILAASLAIGCGPSKEGIDVQRVPADLRDDYALFARKCSKCHSLARPLEAGVTDDEHWTRYVNRMRRQPGSGISMQDQEHILKFLYWYAADLRAKKAGKETAPPAPSASSAAPLPAPLAEDGGAP